MIAPAPRRRGRTALWVAIALALLGSGCATGPDGAPFSGPYFGTSGGAGRATGR